MASAPRGTGCYKCGRPGHWSRDCPSAPALDSPDPAAAPVSGSATTSTVSRFFGSGNKNQGSAQGYKRKESWGDGERKAPFTRGKTSEEKAKPPPVRHKMPKLTPDLLLGADGLGYVLEKVPRQVTIKGRGHEVEDLKSLLEAYVRWHSVLLPFYSYSQFVEKVEKLGANKRVRLCLKELREKLARGEQLESADCNREADSGGASRVEELNTMPSCQGEKGKRWDEECEVVENPADPPLDVLEEYFQGGTEASAVNQSAATPAPTSNPVLIVGHVSSDGNEQRIKDEQRARMDANKQKALERARARKVELEQSTSTVTP